LGLLIQTTSPDVTAPQIATVISPIENIEAEYGVLELNHTTQPDYSDGGIQLQRWNGDFICSTRTANSHARLTTPDERITFTMTMKISGGKLAFGVINGKSQTWGDFGGEPYWRTRTDSAYPESLCPENPNWICSKPGAVVQTEDCSLLQERRAAEDRHRRAGCV
jgi:hypothetical protein